jgi:hypothetical protein
MKLNSKHLSLAMAIGLVFSPVTQADDCAGGTLCDDFTQLMDFLQSEGRRNPEYRIVQARFDMDTVTPPHRQYSKSCYFFGVAPIIEHLGYTMFNPGGSYNYMFNYAAADGLKTHRSFNAGYYLSPEHLMAKSVQWESVYNRCEYDGGWVCDPFPPSDGVDSNWQGFYSDATLTRINTRGASCANRFAAGQEYGQCSDITSTYQAWLDAARNGCGGGTCRPDADTGMFWFANQVLHNDAGCNDMRGFAPDPSDYTEKKHMRRVVKGFVDHDLPLLVSVRQGGHFMMLVGYFDLDSTGLPRQAILHDSSGSYRLASLTSNWDVYDNGSLRDLFPWNHHLDGACDAGGWAASLDALSDEFQLCTMPDGWSASCAQERVFGTELICEDNGSERSRYFAYDGDLFITETANTSCDTIKLRYADGERQIESVSIQRYWYSPNSDEWLGGSVYRPNLLTTEYSSVHDSPTSVVEWDSAWPDNYWLVADGLSGTYTKRRSTVRMTLDDGSVKTLEITPPQTYGVELQCIDNTSVRSSYAYEADHGVFRVADTESFRDRQFFYEYNDRSCDEIKLRVNLGAALNVVSATVQRMYYSSANAEWRPAQSAWWPDYNSLVRDGLSGYTHELTWGEVWPDNQWLVADGVGSGSTYGDRKTVISLFDGDLNLIREIEVVPY